MGSKTFGGKILQHAFKFALALSLAGSAALAAPAADAANQNTVSATEAANLVNQYETIGTFKGQNTEFLPEELTGSFTLGGVQVRLGSSTNSIRQDGFIDYGTTDTGLRVVAASDGTTTSNRFGIIVTDNDADAGGHVRLTVPVDLPTDATVDNREDGSIVVSHPGNPNGDQTPLPPAMAVDSVGANIPSHYEINGNDLLITADLSNATGPVLIDPVANWCYWWGCDSFYSRNEVARTANYYSTVNIAQIACNWMGPVAGVCRSVVGRYTNWIADTWRAARTAGQCVKMSMTWTGQVTSLYRYNCTWY